VDKCYFILLPHIELFPIPEKRCWNDLYCLCLFCYIWSLSLLSFGIFVLITVFTLTNQRWMCKLKNVN